MRLKLALLVMVPVLLAGCLPKPPAISLSGNSAERDQAAAQKAREDEQKLRLVQGAREIESIEDAIIQTEKRIAYDSDLSEGEKSDLQSKIQQLREARRLIRANLNTIQTSVSSGSNSLFGSAFARMREGALQNLQTQIDGARTLVADLNEGNDAFRARLSSELNAATALVGEQSAAEREVQQQLSSVQRKIDQNVWSRMDDREKDKTRRDAAGYERHVRNMGRYLRDRNLREEYDRDLPSYLDGSKKVPRYMRNAAYPWQTWGSNGNEYSGRIGCTLDCLEDFQYMAYLKVKQEEPKYNNLLNQRNQVQAELRSFQPARQRRDDIRAKLTAFNDSEVILSNESQEYNRPRNMALASAAQRLGPGFTNENVSAKLARERTSFQERYGEQYFGGINYGNSATTEYLAILDNVAVPTSYDYTYDFMDITFWDVPSEREAVTGSPLAPETAAAPNRLVNYPENNEDLFVALTGVPFGGEGRPTDVAGLYQGTIKHFYQLDFGSWEKGVGSIDINFETSNSFASAAFTLADADGNNLLYGENNEFRFTSFMAQPNGNSGTITHGEFEVGSATDMAFYGEDGSNIGGKITVDVDNIEGLQIPVSEAYESLQSRGVFGAQKM